MNARVDALDAQLAKLGFQLVQVHRADRPPLSRLPNILKLTDWRVPSATRRRSGSISTDIRVPLEVRVGHRVIPRGHHVHARPLCGVLGVIDDQVNGPPRRTTSGSQRSTKTIVLTRPR